MSEGAPAPDAAALVFTSGGISVTRASGPRVASLLFFAVYGTSGVLGVVGGALRQDPISVFPFFASTLAWPLLFASYVMSLTPKAWQPGTVEVRPLELVVRRGSGAPIRLLRRRPVLPGTPKGAKNSAPTQEQIVGALVVERRVGDGHVPTVEIETHGGDRIAVRFADKAEARLLVERLGFGPGGARVRSRLARPSRRLLHPLLGALSWWSGLGAAIALAAFLGGPRDSHLEQLVFAGLWPLCNLLIYLGLRRVSRPPEVVVGDDGAMVERGLRRRFVSRADLARGAPLPLGGVGLDRERVAEVHKLVAERHVATAVTAEARDAFARAGRSLSEWRAELRAKMDQGGYRSAATSVETAAAVLRSPDATREQRIGAAVALRVAGEPVEKIRIAADAAADDGLRDALDAVAADDDRRAEKALRRLRA